jgi:hypothetical protein
LGRPETAVELELEEGQDCEAHDEEGDRHRVPSREQVPDLEGREDVQGHAAQDVEAPDEVPEEVGQEEVAA